MSENNERLDAELAAPAIEAELAVPDNDVDVGDEVEGAAAETAAAPDEPEAGTGETGLEDIDPEDVVATAVLVEEDAELEAAVEAAVEAALLSDAVPLFSDETGDSELRERELLELNELSDMPLLGEDIENGIAEVFAALQAAAERGEMDLAEDADLEDDASDAADIETSDIVTFRLLGELDRLWHRAA